MIITERHLDRAAKFPPKAVHAIPTVLATAIAIVAAEGTTWASAAETHVFARAVRTNLTCYTGLYNHCPTTKNAGSQTVYTRVARHSHRAAVRATVIITKFCAKSCGESVGTTTMLARGNAFGRAKL